MLNYFQAVVLGLLQGLTELFPISSLGHSVILPKLLGWQIQQGDNAFVIFLVATHLATALVLLGFFWRDWLRILAGFFRSLREREIRDSDPDAKLAWLLIVATIPAGFIGLALEQPLQNLFASAQIAAFFLILNGVLLLAAERLSRRTRGENPTIADSDTRIARLTWWQAITVGAAQAIALIPGFSRTGASMTGSLGVGLSHEDAARYSFLLATPIIGAAAFLKLPELALSGETQIFGPLVAGALCAGVAAYLAVRFLTRYFKANTLTPFAIYCLAAGALSLVLLLRH